MKKKNIILLSLVALTILGLFTITPCIYATSNFGDLYDAAHGNPAGTTSCTLCHTTPPALNADGTTLDESANPPGSTNFNYCSIGPATGSCASAVTPPVIDSFTATPASITPGQSSMLSWTLSGGAPTTLSIDNGVGSVLGTTSTSVSPSATTIYTLTASNADGTATRSVTVTVSSSAPTVWSGTISFSLRETFTETDSSGKEKFVTSTEPFAGTISLSLGADGLTRDAEGCYVRLLGTDGTIICIEEIAAISTESIKSRSEKNLIIGWGSFTSTVDGNPVEGIAYMDAKGTLKEDSSNNLLSIGLNGKIGGGVNSDFVFNGSFRATLTPL